MRLIRSGGRVLDLACGSGRHAAVLAAAGLRVLAVDRDPQALSATGRIPGVEVLQADLEGGPWPFVAEAFDGIVVANYLHRPLFPAIQDALRAGGVLIYETFMQGQAQFGKPSNPAFLLESQELLRRLDGLQIVAYEQGVLQGLRPRAVQRAAAVKSPGAGREWLAPLPLPLAG